MSVISKDSLLVAATIIVTAILIVFILAEGLSSSKKQLISFEENSCQQQETQEKRIAKVKTGCAVWSSSSGVSVNPAGNPARICISPIYSDEHQTKWKITCSKEEWK